MNKPINLSSKFELFNEHWSPKVIAELNDYQFKLVKIKGQFTWHEHKETDEVFLVIEGFMGIEFKDFKVTLKEGEMQGTQPDGLTDKDVYAGRFVSWMKDKTIANNEVGANPILH